MNHPKTCASCVLPETPNLTFDRAGLCPLCQSPTLLGHICQKPDPAALGPIIDRIKERGAKSEYDCVVAWSGGRDSTHMLHELTTVHGLRCLAVFGRTPFAPAEIIENVRRIARRLEIELVETASPKNHLDIARFCLKRWVARPDPILVNLACAPCKLINREIFRQAAGRRIRTVIYGGNRLEYFPFGPASVDISRANRYSFGTMILDNALRMIKGLKTLTSTPVLMKHFSTLGRGSFLYVNQYSPYLRVRYPGIWRFDYYHHADWDENRVETTLAQLGWRLPEGCVSSWRADCLFEAVKNSAFQRQLGYTYHHALLSNMIRAGLLTRQQALDRLRNIPENERRLHAALELLNIDKENFIRS